MARHPSVYILANRRNGTLYIGVTSEPGRRLLVHRMKLVDGFSAKHDTTRLVYLERHDTMIGAITREKQLKKWKRAWKLALIEAQNPYWRDLLEELL